MSERMWSLSQFRYDEGIDAPEVDVLLDDGLEPMSRDEAIAYAHEHVRRADGGVVPGQAVGYNVSLDEMGEMSDAARHWVAGYLAGAEPDHPYPDHEGDVDDADMAAWEAALRRFRRTGTWYSRWGTCQVCGCVLLPDTAANRCAEHHR